MVVNSTACAEQKAGAASVALHCPTHCVLPMNSYILSPRSLVIKPCILCLINDLGNVQGFFNHTCLC